MKKEINFKSSEIVSITIVLEEIYDSISYDYVNYSGFLKFFYKPGIYELSAFGYYSKRISQEKLPKHLVVKNKKLFYKPYMLVKTSDDYCRIFYETEKELMDACNKLKNKVDCKWINFKI